MSLNPVQFGTEVIDQFGRWLLTTFPIADSDPKAQLKVDLGSGDYTLADWAWPDKMVLVFIERLVHRSKLDLEVRRLR